ADLGRRLDEPEPSELWVAQDRDGALDGHPVILREASRGRPLRSNLRTLQTPTKRWTGSGAPALGDTTRGIQLVAPAQPWLTVIDRPVGPVEAEGELAEAHLDERRRVQL